MGAEIRRTAALHQVGCAASTEPHPVGRGDMRFQSGPGSRIRTFQRRRTHLRAEIAGNTSTHTRPLTLQRSRTQLGAEMRDRKEGALDRRSASTEPHPVGRGDYVIEPRHLTFTKLQRSRTQLGAEMLRLGEPLQSHCARFNGAAPSWARRYWVLGRPGSDALASTEPHPVGRGDRNRMPRTSGPLNCFNGAAPSWARR